MNTSFLYHPFPRFIFRTPLFPLDRLRERGDAGLLFDEALYLASPEFFWEKQKHEGKPGADRKVKSTLYKYDSRACTRCTPFGLFAGCSTGCIGEQTKIKLDSIARKRYTRLVVYFISAQNIEVWQKVVFGIPAGVIIYFTYLIICKDHFIKVVKEMIK